MSQSIWNLDESNLHQKKKRMLFYNFQISMRWISHDSMTVAWERAWEGTMPYVKSFTPKQNFPVNQLGEGVNSHFALSEMWFTSSNIVPTRQPCIISRFSLILRVQNSTKFYRLGVKITLPRTFYLNVCGL